MASCLGQVKAIEWALDRRQRGGGHVDVAGGGAETTMAEQDLDGPQVGAGLEQMGGETVAQGMGRDVLAHTGGPPSTLANLLDAGGGNGPVEPAPGKRMSWGRTALQ